MNRNKNQGKNNVQFCCELFFSKLLCDFSLSPSGVDRSRYNTHSLTNCRNSTNLHYCSFSLLKSFSNLPVSCIYSIPAHSSL